MLKLIGDSKFSQCLSPVKKMDGYMGEPGVLAPSANLSAVECLRVEQCESHHTIIYVKGLTGVELSVPGHMFAGSDSTGSGS